jgi:acyl transferase domain-containing protein
MPHAVSPERGHGFDPAEPIAVVGMAMRFPGGATDSKRFWDSKCDRFGEILHVVPPVNFTLTFLQHVVLQSGRSAHRPIPKSRFNVDGYYHPDGARIGAVRPHPPGSYITCMI